MNLPLREVRWLNGSLTLPVFGLETWLSCFKTTSLRPVLEHDRVQEREHLPRGGLPCVPRGTQGKQQPQGPNRGRSGRSIEDKNRPLEKRSREPSVSLAAYPAYALRTLGGHPSRGYFSHRPPSPILVGLFLSISHPCGVIVQTANLVDSLNDNRSRETEGTTCLGLSDQPDCTGCAVPGMATRDDHCHLPSTFRGVKGSLKMRGVRGQVGQKVQLVRGCTLKRPPQGTSRTHTEL